MNRRARLAVAGLGRIGLLHARNLIERVPSADLVLIADPDGKRAQRAGEAFDVPWSTDVEEVLADATIQGIVIATPTGLHADMVEAAARSGKHVFVEKPIALDVGSAHRAVTAAHAAGIHLQVGFQRRFDAAWRAAQVELERGTIGSPRLLRIAHRNMAVSPDVPLHTLGDILIDVAVHDFDCACWLLGEPAQIVAVAAIQSAEGASAPSGSDAVAVLIRFTSGSLAMIDTARSSNYGYECSGEVLGATGVLRIGTQHRPLDLERLLTGEARVTLATDHESRYELAYVAELEHFARVTLGQLEPEPTGEDGEAALELVQAARIALARSMPVAVSPNSPPAARTAAAAC